MISKKRLVIICSILVAIALTAIGLKTLFWHLSLRDVSFKLSSKVESVVLYKDYNSHSSSPTEVASFGGDTTIKIEDGLYAAVPAGKNIDTSAISISVNKDSTEFKINPHYNEDHLSNQLQKELSQIHQVISNEYNSIIGQYSISAGRLLVDGTWYVTNITPKEAIIVERIGSSTVYYKIILQKQGGIWKIVASPDLVFKYTDYPKIPKTVVNAANQYLK
jgi:hypothetical protein